MHKKSILKISIAIHEKCSFILAQSTFKHFIDSLQLNKVGLNDIET